MRQEKEPPEGMIPMKSVTLQWLSECPPAVFRVITRLIEANREIRTKMPKCADHLLRYIHVDDVGFCYSPGDEPAFRNMEDHIDAHKKMD